MDDFRPTLLGRRPKVFVVRMSLRSAHTTGLEFDLNDANDAYRTWATARHIQEQPILWGCITLGSQLGWRNMPQAAPELQNEPCIVLSGELLQERDKELYSSVAKTDEALNSLAGFMADYLEQNYAYVVFDGTDWTLERAD